MRIYSAYEEESVKAQKALRDWAASGLIRADQKTVMEKEVDAGLQRTSGWLRAALCLFSMGSVWALVGLAFSVFRFQASTASVWLLLGGLTYGLAEYILSRGTRKLYRYGVEEGLVIVGTTMFLIGLFTLLHPRGLWGSQLGNQMSALISLIAAGLGWAIYQRFGYLYAAFWGLLSLVFVPVYLVSGLVAQRLWVAGLFLVLWAILRPVRLQHRQDFLDESYGVLQATVVLGLYLTLNLQISTLDIWRHTVVGLSVSRTLNYPDWFYWTTYGVVWLLPMGVLYLALRDRDRAFTAAGVVMALLTLMTNKPYLGWARHEWDPMLLGGFLMGLAVYLRRWLVRAPEGQRHGFTAERLSASDKRLISALGTASYALRPGHTAAPASGETDFGGGRSGGGGAQGNF